MKALTTILAIVVGYSPIFLFMLLFNRLRRSAKRIHPRQDGGALEFFVAPGMRILIRSVLFSLIAFTALYFATSLFRGGEGWYAIFIPLTVLLAILLAIPRTVTLDSNGIRQRRWVRADREILWTEIAWMRRGVNTGTTYIKSKHGGRPVSFSPLLVGQSRFEREVRAHTRECEILCSDSDEE